MLTERLMAIADMIEDSELTADVGTDHGYLAKYLIENKKAKKVLATDVNDGPLKNCFLATGGMKEIELRKSDGLLSIHEKPDVIVIAGMGGHLILKILSDSIEKVMEAGHIILQPMNDKMLVRKYLLDNLFEITDEKVAIEGNKYYEIIKARYSGKRDVEYDLELGKMLFDGSDNSKMYIEEKIRKTRLIIADLEKSGGNLERLQYFRERLEAYREVYDAD